MQKTGDNPEQLALQAVKAAFAPSLAMLSGESSFCIYGAGEVGRLLFHLCRQQGLRPAAFLDDLSSSTSCCGIPWIRKSLLSFRLLVSIKLFKT